MKLFVVYYISVIEEILLLFVEEDCIVLEYLFIDCWWEEKFGKDIILEMWEFVMKKILKFCVMLVFDILCLMFKVDMILKLEILVKNLWLEVMFRVVI